MTEDSGGTTPNLEFKDCTLTLAQLLQMKLFLARDTERHLRSILENAEGPYSWGIRDMISVVKK